MNNDFAGTLMTPEYDEWHEQWKRAKELAQDLKQVVTFRHRDRKHIGVDIIDTFATPEAKDNLAQHSEFVQWFAGRLEEQIDEEEPSGSFNNRLTYRPSWGWKKDKYQQLRILGEAYTVQYMMGGQVTPPDEFDETVTKVVGAQPLIMERLPLLVRQNEKILEWMPQICEDVFIDTYEALYHADLSDLASILEYRFRKGIWSTKAIDLFSLRLKEEVQDATTHRMRQYHEEQAGNSWTHIPYSNIYVHPDANEQAAIVDRWRQREREHQARMRQHQQEQFMEMQRSQTQARARAHVHRQRQSDAFDPTNQQRYGSIVERLQAQLEEEVRS